jgi:hypothetical protein
VCPVRHRGSGVLGKQEAQGAEVLRMRKNQRAEGKRERKKKMGRQSPKPAPVARF